MRSGGSADVLIALGDVRREAGQPDLAYAAYRRRCELVAEDGEALARLAEAALAMGDFAVARDALRRAHRFGARERGGEIAAPALRDRLAPSSWRLLQALTGREPTDEAAGGGPPLAFSRTGGTALRLHGVRVVSVLAPTTGSGDSEIRRAMAAGASLPSGWHLAVALYAGTPPTAVLATADKSSLLVLEAGEQTSRRSLIAFGLDIARGLDAHALLRWPTSDGEPDCALEAALASFDDPTVGCAILSEGREISPRGLYGPPTLGPLMLLRSRLLQEFEGLDAVFDEAEAAVLDLCARANRAAFAAVRLPMLTTRARPAGASESDAAVLRGRHPDLLGAELDFAQDSEVRARNLERALAAGRPRVLIDLSNMRPHHDGTSRMSVALLQALEGLDRFDVTVACSREAARGHRLDGFAAAGRLVEPGVKGAWTACVKLSQPLSAAEMVRTWSAAPVAGFVMHDAIIANSEALGAARVRELWRLALGDSELVGFVSGFAEAQFRRRFPVAEGIERFVMRNSTAACEYAGLAGGAAARRRGLLVVGNPFGHKNLDAAVRRLRARRPETPLTVLGQMRSGEPEVRWLHSGRLSDAEVAALYAGAEAVVFPSFQEGFGMPLLDALAAGAPVLALDQPAYREIIARSGLGANVHLFPTTEALVEGVDAVLATGFLPPDGGVVEHTWRDAAVVLAEAVERAIAAYDPARLRRRLAVVAALRAAEVG